VAIDPAVAGEALWFAHPALAADGQRFLAEARRLIITVIRDGTGFPIGADTSSSEPPDVWLGSVP
jgi:hypothetical protein